MGIIMGKFRKKKSTYDVLDRIDKEIKSIEEYRRNTEQSHKRIVGRFILISVGIYLVTAFLFYFYYFPATFYDRLFYIIPLILAPVILLSVKRVLTWFYNWKITRKQSKLVSLRNDKKKLLDTVMETETYKVAKNILDKFAPELEAVRNPSNMSLMTSNNATPSRALALPQSSLTGLRQRQTSSQSFLSTPARPIATAMSTTRSEVTHKPELPVIRAPARTPSNILPRDRSVFDKMVDYLVGDGPSNRFALICKQCSSHNGMIFPEEYEYTSFRCCYCFTFNPSRKKKPLAPKLQLGNISARRKSSSTSDSEKNSPSDTESEPEFLTSHEPQSASIGQAEAARLDNEEEEHKLSSDNESHKEPEAVEPVEQAWPVEEIHDIGDVKVGEGVNIIKD